jgi:hypothetical protein
VQVHHDEGVANRIDPESCADAREGIGEALTGERIGQPLSRESTSRRSPHGRASRLTGFARMPAAYMAKTSAPLPSRSMTRPGA